MSGAICLFGTVLDYPMYDRRRSCTFLACQGLTGERWLSVPEKTRVLPNLTIPSVEGCHNQLFNQLVERINRYEKEKYLYPLFRPSYPDRRHCGLFIDTQTRKFGRSDSANHDDDRKARDRKEADHDHHDDRKSIVGRAGSKFSSLQGMALQASNT